VSGKGDINQKALADLEQTLRKQSTSMGEATIRLSEAPNPNHNPTIELSEVVSDELLGS